MPSGASLGPSRPLSLLAPPRLRRGCRSLRASLLPLPALWLRRAGHREGVGLNLLLRPRRPLQSTGPSLKHLRRLIRSNLHRSLGGPPLRLILSRTALPLPDWPHPRTEASATGCSRPLGARSSANLLSLGRLHRRKGFPCKGLHQRKTMTPNLLLSVRDP